MERHLIKQRTSYVISLPINWVRQNHLDGGASLSVTEQNSNLLISATLQRAEKNMEILFGNECSDMVWMKMIAAYVSGYTNITLIFEKEEVPYTRTAGNDTIAVSQLLNDMGTQFVGMELFERTTTRGVFRNLLIEGQKEMENAVHRMFHLITEMLREMIETQKYATIIDMDISVNRLKNFCLRMLNMHPQKQQSFLLKLVDCLEQLADGITQLLRHSIKNKPSAALIKRCNALLTLLDDTHAAYNGKDINDAVVATKRLAQSLEASIENAHLLRIIDMLSEVQEAVVGINLEKTR